MTKYLQRPSVALRITGPDANTFLQGQFSQNVRIILGGISYGLWLNQKGRPVADSYVARLSEDEHWVFSFRLEPAVIRERLESYLIADDVEISDKSAEWQSVILWGPGAEKALSDLGWEIPLPGKVSIAEGAFVFAARFCAGPNFAVMCRREFAGALSERLRAGGATPGSGDDLERARIEGGVPSVPDDIGLTELPNEGGLDSVAVSFTKGCFLGQEVMARLKNLGQVRRRLFRIRGVGAPPARTVEILQAGKKIGDTRTAVANGDGFVGFAMVSLMNFARGEAAQLADGRSVSVEELSHG